MTEELWNACQNGTLDRIARTQRNRNHRRVWLARSLTGFLILLVPSIALFAYMSATSISCQQAIAWFDSANGGKLTSAENRSFKFHLLTCGKCRESYSQFKQNTQTTILGQIGDQQFVTCNQASGSCSCSECGHPSSSSEQSNQLSLVVSYGKLARTE